MSADPIALVTGAAGGIGSAICTRLEYDGFEVVGIDRQSSARRRHVVLDMNESGELAQLTNVIDQSRVVAIVHNAAVQPLGAAGSNDLETWIEALRVNVIAADALVGAFQGGLEANQGSVVVMSSVHARATTQGISAYASTKAALEGWVRAACLDLGPRIRVNAIAPGAIDTAKLREGFERWEPVERIGRLKELERRTALARVGTPAEVAALVSFLVGSESSFITGTTVTIDGGASARLGSE